MHFHNTGKYTGTLLKIKKANSWFMHSKLSSRYTTDHLCMKFSSIFFLGGVHATEVLTHFKEVY